MIILVERISIDIGDESTDWIEATRCESTS